MATLTKNGITVTLPDDNPVVARLADMGYVTASEPATVAKPTPKRAGSSKTAASPFSEAG